MTFAGNIPLLKRIREVETTQGYVARKAGITETRFTRIIRGYVTPTIDEIDRICEALDCTGMEIGFENGEQFQDPKGDPKLRKK